ncbi:Ribosomal protein [Parasponia andersonii]|uniref:Ribosomal protein n=1 Tax=Parasponia andersonii TaxID=3476 RepID=A0A2P5DUI7_PARAD|nr:Ribosomal protein [Parasponia andersonii]
MYSLSCIRHARRPSSLTSLLTRDYAHLTASRSFSVIPAKSGPQESSQDSSKSFDDISRRKIVHNVWGLPASSNLSSTSMHSKRDVSAPYSLSFLSSIHSASKKDIETRENHMNFVRGVVEEDERNLFGVPRFPRYNVEHNADFVHIKLMRNNTFVTVTDSKGNKKIGASAGSLPEMKGGAKLSRYAAEATAEHVGRMAKNLGLKSVVMKVKGFTHFKKKRQAIMSWREGFTNSRGDQNPVVYIEDTTRRPHNGCRLPKKRRT